MINRTCNISVIICAYSEERWHDLVAAVTSLQRQQTPPREIIVVIDHNPTLLEQARKFIANVVVVENQEQRGLSGARNSGIAVARGKYIAFFDDDIIAEPDCLTRLHQCFANPDVAGVGGNAIPLWSGQQPAWFPEEFNWIVGCSYRGLPATQAEVRNPLGCCCCFRREVFETVGGFRHGIGRVGKHPLGCEETELCIRARQHQSHYRFLYEPRASIQHRIPAYRASWRYFCSRCYAEGLSKAAIARFVGTQDALTSERSYVMRTLPLGILRGLRDTLVHQNWEGMQRAVAIVVGFAVTTAGYIVGRAALPLAKLQGMISGKTTKHMEVGELMSSYPPARMLEIDLGQPLPPISAFDEETGQTYERAYCLVRLHTQPLGMIELQLETCGLSADEYTQHIWNALGDKILEHLQEDGLPQVTGLDALGLCYASTPRCLEERDKFSAAAPFVSIIVPTHERTEHLRDCLQSLVSLHYPAYEVIVVDNAPVTNATANLIQQTYSNVPWIRYIRENRPGASFARNCGILAAKGEILAFTDDDAIVDSSWLVELVRAFNTAGNVSCVTGLVLPVEMETPAQFWFEEYGGFSKNFQRRIFDRTKPHPDLPLHPYTAGQFGSGVSAAFTAAFLRSVNGFDTALGPGVPARAGEDLALFFQVIMHGHKLVYTPASLVYHLHRRDYTCLRQQMYNYGIGLSAYLTKNVYDAPRLLFDFAAKIPYGLYFTLSHRSSKNKKKTTSYPKELTRLELKGFFYGPFAYLRGRWLMRNVHQFSPSIDHRRLLSEKEQQCEKIIV